MLAHFERLPGTRAEVRIAAAALSAFGRLHGGRRRSGRLGRGRLHDLQSVVTTTYSTAPGGIPHDTGQTMAFFNMQRGDAPLFLALADQYSMSDNYHQPVLGGTG